MVFTTVLYSETEEKQIWNAAEEIVLKELVYIESVESSFGSFLPFLQTIFSRAGKQSIYMEQMQREKILEGYDS